MARSENLPLTDPAFSDFSTGSVADHLAGLYRSPRQTQPISGYRTPPEIRGG